MDKDQAHRYLIELKLHMFDEGILNDYFLSLEALEDGKPEFVENLIGKYFSSSQAYMDELGKTLATKPLDLATVERLINKLKGGSGSMGAGRLENIVGEMLQIFKERRYERLSVVFERIKEEHAYVKLHLEPYAELLRMMEDPADEASNNCEDVESIDTNDVTKT